MNAATERVVMLEPALPAAAGGLEGGFLRIANDLYDAILRHDLTGRQLKILMSIIRKTYGYGKKFDDISASQLGDLCGMARNHVTTTLRQLVAMRIVTVRPGRYGQVVSINKDINAWAGGTAPDGAAQPASPKMGLVPNRDADSPKTGLEVVPNWDSASPEMGHTKDNPKKQLQKTTTKDKPQPQAAGGKSGRRAAAGTVSLTAELQERFDRFWAAYPRREGKQAAIRIWASLQPTEDVLAEMLAGLAAARTAGRFADAKFIKHPTTWLNAGGWQDELQTAYEPAEAAVIDAYNEALGETLGRIDPAIFSESRASQIRDFLTLSPNPEFWAAFFPWVAENCDLPPHVGFDYLTSRRGFSAVKGGQHQRSVS